MNDYKQITSVDNLKALAQRILDQAKHEGAHQAQVDIALNKGFTVSVHDGDVETVEYHQDKVIDITVYFNKRSGSASLSDIRPHAIVEAVKAACHIASYTDSDPASGLAEKNELAFNYPNLKLALPWAITVGEAIQLACQCERDALAFDKRIMSAEACGVSTLEATHLYANTHGFVGTYPVSRHEMNCVLVAKENDDMQRDYSYTIAVDPAKLDDVSYLARMAAERTIYRLGARTIPTRKAPVIFHAEQARGLLGHFAQAIQGGNLYRKTSFLLNQLGKQIFPNFMQIAESPHLAYALGSAPFDNDGVATRANIFIEGGVLRNYALGVYSARKLGMETTGNAGGTHNLIVNNANKDFTALLKEMGKGLLVTELMGQGVNLLTGDYSRGAAGYWVENGEIQFPVQGITIAGKLQDIYKNVVEIANDVDVRGNIRTGSILIEEMTVAGS